jgi:signal transduction histidine kinase
MANTVRRDPEGTHLAYQRAAALPRVKSSSPHPWEMVLHPFKTHRFVTAVRRDRRISWLRKLLSVGPLLVLIGALLLESILGVLVAVALSVVMIMERERLRRERAENKAGVLALRDANQRLDEFLSIAGHELRTPLTIMKANIQMAVRRVHHLVSQADTAGYGAVHDVGALQAMLGRVAGAVDRQDRLVTDLLDVSRIRTGELELTPTLLDLADLLQGIVQEFHLTYPERVLTLTVPDHPVLVTADSERIGQVIDNYLTNALNYSAAEHPLEIRLDSAAGLARASVRDHGLGLDISTKEHARIWDRFHRVPSITPLSGSSVGLGLGLYSTRQIVERHGGMVGLESAEGEGPIFWFTLPLAAKSQSG